VSEGEGEVGRVRGVCPMCWVMTGFIISSAVEGDKARERLA